MPCSHGNRSPRELVEAQIKQHDPTGYPSTIMWFGRTTEEILKALELFDNSNYKMIYKANKTYVSRPNVVKEQIKMTREAALNRVIKFGASEDTLNILEALGLLKFDEVNPYRAFGITDHNLQALDKAGYMIIKVS